LFTGLVPIVAAVSGLLLGGPMPRPVVWIGVTVVLVGLSVGLAGRKATVETTVDSPAAVTAPSG
jgi:threonine/homoserine efflux transporter RhtA